MKIWVIVTFLLYLTCACSTYDVTLDYSSNHPIQFGKLRSPEPLDTLQAVVGTVSYEFEEDTYTENENTSITISGDTEITNDLEVSMYAPLEREKGNFIGDGKVQLCSKHGFHPGTFLMGLVASSITNSEIDPGTYTKQTFSHQAYLYNVNRKKEMKNE